MEIQHYKRNSFHFFNKSQLSLANNQLELGEFIGLPFSEESFQEQIELKKNSYRNEYRLILQNVLLKSYDNLELNAITKRNIELLGENNTFTITCGHQLTLFGGPAYFFYKIIHVISLSKRLNQLYENNNFVPVFWLASEDHDKDEITDLKIYNSKFYWDTEATGACGKYRLDEAFEKIKTEFIDLFSNSEFDEIKNHISNFKGKNIAEGITQFIYSIFKSFGLIILDSNCEQLKTLFKPIIKEEIEKFIAFKNVSDTNSRLKERNIEPQAKIQNLNLFYLKDNQRIKIKFENNEYIIGETRFTLNQLLKEVDKYPELFSPNVFLRPIFQELILPNLAFVGGPSELSYWLQLKNLFDSCNIPYPLIAHRLSVIFIDKSTKKKINKFKFDIPEYFNEQIHHLKKKFIRDNTDFQLNWESTDIYLDKAQNAAREIYRSNAPEIQNSIDAEWSNIEKSIGKIKSKLEKQLLEKHEQSIKALDQIKNKILPDSIPQERYFHFFHFCPKGNLALLNELIDNYNPFDTSILVIYED